MLSAGSASAQTWNGNTSSDWTVGSNWNGGAVPAGTATVQISGSNAAVLGVGGPTTGVTGTVEIAVGTGATGSLTIQNGSVLTSSGLVAGIQEGQNGTATVTVTGAGSQWDITRAVLFIGWGVNGRGTLDIENGGEVIAQNGVRFGDLTNASGVLNVNSGGMLETTVLTKTAVGNAQANFDNGILRAMASTTSFFVNLTPAQLNIAAGGLTFDTNGFTVGAPGFSGVGDLTVTGVGTLDLQGASTYSGQTMIQSGSTLALLSAGSIAASSGVVANGTFDISGLGTGSSIQSLAGSGTVSLGANTLTLTNANDTFAGAFTGSGGLVLASGNETLTGNSSGFSGSTAVQSGTLTINGTLGGTLDVLSGGTLQGTGTVGATTVHTGATIIAGDAIGTLHVNGAYTQQSGSTYQVLLDPTSNASSLIAINGTATLQSGAIVNASKVTPGTYLPNAVYKVLSATGGVTGTYVLTGDTAVSAFLALKDAYDANDVYLQVVETRDPVAVTQTPNQAATAGGIRGTGVDAVVLNSQSDDAARNALDQLSGASYASVKGAMIYDSRYTRALAIDRLRDLFCTTGYTPQPDATHNPGGPADGAGCVPNPDRFAIWGQGFGSWGHSGGNANAGGIDRSSGGFVSGIDAPVWDNWRVGLLAGYSRSNFGANAQNASAGSDDYHIGLYGGTQWGLVALRLGGSFTWHDVSSTRTVALPQLFNSLGASYNAATSQAFAELGYRMKAGPIDLEPYVNLAYINLHNDGFVEQGGAAALMSRGGDLNSAFTTLGVRASTDFMLGSVAATARGTLGWLHAYGDITPSSVMSFASGNPFTVTGVPIATDAAVVEAGFDLHIAPQATLGISYNGQFGNRATDQGLRGNLTMRF